MRDRSGCRRGGGRSGKRSASTSFENWFRSSREEGSDRVSRTAEASLSLSLGYRRRGSERR